MGKFRGATGRIEQRARWSPLQVYVVLMFSGLIAALSYYNTVSYAPTRHVQLPEVQVRNAGKNTTTPAAHLQQASAAAATANSSASAAAAAATANLSAAAAATANSSASAAAATANSSASAAASAATANLSAAASAATANLSAAAAAATANSSASAAAAAATANSSSSAAAATANSSSSAAAATANSSASAAASAATANSSASAAAATANSSASAAAATVNSSASAAAGAAARLAGPCHVEPHAEYGGDVIEQGDKHVKASPEECCAACRAAQDRGCNVWVFCAATEGCGIRKQGECWLKNDRKLNIIEPAGYRDKSVPWTSGALFDDAKREQLVSAEVQRLAKLRDDPELPLVYFDVSIKGVPQGRITMVLFIKEAPRAAENFRQLCTGEHGFTAPDANGKRTAYHYKGAPFYRIIYNFIDQAGIETDSVFGGKFKDDPAGLRLQHDRKGLLSIAHLGPHTATAHFSIMAAPAMHLNGKHTVFGEVVSGYEVVKVVNELGKGKKDGTATKADGAVITDSGQLRRGTYKPNLQQM